jgi:major membrane immunogen (membrane-anchored lipoprotein)
MKRKLVSKITLLIVMIMTMTCLAACGGSKSSDTSKESTEATVKETLTEEDGTIGGPLEDGTYTMTSLSIDGEESSKMMSSLQKMGISMDLVVNGTQIKMMNKEYTLKDGEFVSDEGSATYAVDGSVVTVLDDENSKMVFEKQ